MRKISLIVYTIPVHRINTHIVMITMIMKIQSIIIVIPRTLFEDYSHLLHTYIFVHSNTCFMICSTGIVSNYANMSRINVFFKKHIAIYELHSVIMCKNILINSHTIRCFITSMYVQMKICRFRWRRIQLISNSCRIPFLKVCT